MHRIICPDCRLELHWDDEAFAEWKTGPKKCPQCGAGLSDMHVDVVPIASEDQKPTRRPIAGERVERPVVVAQTSGNVEPLGVEGDRRFFPVENDG